MNIYYKDKETEKICNSRGYALRKFPPKVVESLGKLLYKLAAAENFT